jgi:hypothetical protein
MEELDFHNLIRQTPLGTEDGSQLSEKIALLSSEVED